MMPFDLNAIAQLSATQIVDCLVEGTLIAAVAGLALRAGRQDSRTNFAVWFAALLGIAALPFVGVIWSGSGVASAASRSVLRLPESWALYLFCAWAVVAFWSLARVSLGLWHLRKLRNSCVPIDVSELDGSVKSTFDCKRGSRAATLCISDQVQVPTAIGLFRPLVVIPRWTMHGLSPAELNQILLHELAHLRRWDDWTNLAQQVVKALFFFHPAVWWIERKMSVERENACDDSVIAETGSPRAYAECLANLAEKTFIQRSVALAQAALGRIRNTSMRVSRILAVRPASQTKHAWRFAVPIVAMVAGAGVFAASHSPRLVAFTGPVPASPVLASRIDSGISPVSIPATPVTMRQSASAPSTINPLRAKPAKHVTHRIVEDNRQLIADIQPPQIEQFIHLANLSSLPLVPTQAVFVIVEGRETSPGISMYEIRVWHLTVWHPVIDPEGKKAPPKQT